MSTSNTQFAMAHRTDQQTLLQIKLSVTGKWRLAILAFSFLLLIGLIGAPIVKADDVVKPSIQTYEGILKTGIVVPGGETSGITLTTKAGKKYELELKTKELKEEAKTFDGKNVVVTGEYKTKSGIEVKERHIIKVKTLSAAK